MSDDELLPLAQPISTVTVRLVRHEVYERVVAERDRAVASVAALLHAYIGITPGATVGGLAPEVQAEAERLLEERLALESERDNLRDECNALRAALASVGVQDA